VPARKRREGRRRGELVSLIVGEAKSGGLTYVSSSASSLYFRYNRRPRPEFVRQLGSLLSELCHQPVRACVEQGGVLFLTDGPSEVRASEWISILAKAFEKSLKKREAGHPTCHD